MHTRREDTKRPWILAGLGSAVIVLPLALFFGFAAPPPAVVRPVPAARQAMQLSGARADAVLAEEAAMRDLTPLFLPTEHNVAPKKLEAREPGDRFLDVQLSQLSFTDAAPPLARSLPLPITLNGKPLSAVQPLDAIGSDAPATPLFGLGRKEERTSAMQLRGAFIEIVSTRDGQVMVADALPLDARPLGEQAWQPMEFLVVIDAAGLADRPTVTSGSRVDEVDQHFQNYLVRRYRIGERLQPGFYRVTIGP